MTGLLTRLRALHTRRTAALDAIAKADAQAWLAPFIDTPAPTRAGAHPYRPKGTRKGELTATETSRA
ncbi:hypothetical protein [Nonomuraea lactucae]|uniref:hypothetical protein n=1 Tax=Nonomuraea lactucae TaxID=2249762 RepID=UPI000DE35AC9|nr:hypothetical protein [Nonomuraea lactucae]